MEIKFELKGLKELQQNLDRLSKEMKSLEGLKKLSMTEVLTPSFMTRFTQFKTLDEMIEKSPFKVETEEDFKKIPDDEWDKYVKENTSFQNWDEMLTKAGEEHLGRKIKEKIGRALKGR